MDEYVLRLPLMNLSCLHFPWRALLVTPQHKNCLQI